MQKLSRREALRGTGVAALAIGAAAITAVAAAPNTETLVRELVRKLLTGSTAGITVGEWLERKRIAVVLQVLIGTNPSLGRRWKYPT